MFETRDFESAIRDYRTAFKAATSDVRKCDTLRNLSNALFDAGRQSEALSTLSKALEINPADSATLQLRDSLTRALEENQTASSKPLPPNQ